MQKKIENSRKPVISLHESKLLEFLEFFSILLHIALVIFTLVALILAFEHTHVSEKILLTFEILTITVVILIIINYFSTPIIKKIYIKNYFKPFWGDLIVNTKIFIPSKISINEKDYLADVESFEKMGSISNVFIGWTSKNPYNTHLQVIVADQKNVLNSLDGDYDQIHFDISYININTREKEIILEARIIVYESKTQKFHFTDRSFFMKIDKKHQIVKWSGMLPEHPLYGTWEWK